MEKLLKQNDPRWKDGFDRQAISLGDDDDGDDDDDNSLI